MAKKVNKEAEVKESPANKKKVQKDSSPATKAGKKGRSEDKMIKDLNSKLKESKQKIKESHDKYLRLSAEFDNYRKRTLKEKMDLTKSAGEQLMLNLLPVIDDFERGIKNMNDSKELSAIKEGMILIYNKFKDFLNQNGVREIDAAEKEFNIDFHEAITKVPAPKKELKGKVVDIVEKGYTLNDKVIRFSKVVIGE
jgi:molecular chaperone GrpE